MEGGIGIFGPGEFRGFGFPNSQVLGVEGAIAAIVVDICVGKTYSLGPPVMCQLQIRCDKMSG